MKKSILFILILCVFTNLFAQKNSLPVLLNTEYVKADSNTYVIEYYDSDRKYFSNKHNPFEGFITEPWQGKLKKISGKGTDISSIINDVLFPYLRIKKLGEAVYLREFYNLKGDLEYFSLGIPIKSKIPIRVIEKFEDRLKKEVKLELEFDPERAKDVNFISFSNRYKIPIKE